ncbi:MAG: hypothetical protein P1U77_02100 [Rubripirellula sp.]|jgi:hypothetical protein|nr:hypothetical protein [Planctomycetaceae bacterium]MDF1840195.1 hypothetical protein [Rubripirellula sp.]
MDTDKIKNFFINHIEKMILVVVIGVSVFLMYQGLQKPNFLDQHLPARLQQDATQVRGDIDINHNDEVLKDRNPTFDIVRETEKLYTAVEPSEYKLERTWEGKTLESIVRRQDPVMVAATSIELTPVTTAIAFRAQTNSAEPQYALYNLEDADELEKVEKKTRRRRNRNRGGAEMGLGFGGMEGEMGDMEGGMDMEMEMDGDMFGGDMLGMEGDSGPKRTFNAEHDFGFRPSKTEDERLPEPRLGQFIVGTALVPHKELYANFELALADASEYTPARDTPYYYGFEVQRADVTDKPVDQLGDEDWVDIWTRLRYTTLAGKFWSGFAPETVHPEYRDDAFTMWLPPVLLDDYRTWAKHTKIPALSKQELQQLANQTDEVEDFGEFDVDAALNDLELTGPGERSAAGGMDEMMGGGMGMDMGMEMDEMGDMDGMMMGMMMGMSGRGAEVDPVEHKMIRFYDFAGIKNGPVLGRKYVYRIRFSVVDPNFPFSEKQQPQVKNLAPEVATRIQEQMKKAADADSREELFERWSDWSEPSAITSLPTLEHYYVGPVERGPIATATVGGKQVEYSRGEPKAKLLASQYDPKTGARIPVELDVTAGTVLSKDMESADVVDPISLLVKKMPNASLVSGTTVVAIDGAKPLKITEDVQSPGVMLLFDQSGQLTVHDELEDQEMFRVYTYAEERGIE